MKLFGISLWKILIIAAILALIINPGFNTLVSRWTEKIKLEKELKKLKIESVRLQKEIYSLENDQNYIEYCIRKDLGYLKPGETEYRMKVSTNSFVSVTKNK